MSVHQSLQRRWLNLVWGQPHKECSCTSYTVAFTLLVQCWIPPFSQQNPNCTSLFHQPLGIYWVCFEAHWMESLSTRLGKYSYRIRWIDKRTVKILFQHNAGCFRVSPSRVSTHPDLLHADKKLGPLWAALNAQGLPEWPPLLRKVETYHLYLQILMTLLPFPRFQQKARKAAKWSSRQASLTWWCTFWLTSRAQPQEYSGRCAAVFQLLLCIELMLVLSHISSRWIVPAQSTVLLPSVTGLLHLPTGVMLEPPRCAMSNITESSDASSACELPCTGQFIVFEIESWN